MLFRSSVNVTEEAGKLTEELVPQIEKTAKLVQEIAAASVEQSSGADQVNNAIQQLNEVTQQNAAASEEMATSSEELSSQADQLREIISFFKVEEGSKTFRSVQNAPFKEQKNIKKQTQIHKAPQQQNQTKKDEPKPKGIDLNMDKNDNVDDEYENF